jgi:hypothetical protein
VKKSQIVAVLAFTAALAVVLCFTVCMAVLWIRDILVWIRIRGSVPLTNGSAPEPDPDLAIFALDLQDANKKLRIISKVFLLFTF